jgi:hypothetical protein
VLIEQEIGEAATWTSISSRINARFGGAMRGPALGPGPFDRFAKSHRGRAAFAHPGFVHRPFFHRRPFVRHRFPGGAFAAGLIGGAALGTLAAAPAFATPVVADFGPDCFVVRRKFVNAWGDIVIRRRLVCS